MYKKLLTLALVAIFASFAGAKAQTADEIIKKYCDLMGGTEKHDKITNFYQEVEQPIKTKIGDGKITYKIWTEYPSKRRLEVYIDVDTIHEKTIIACTEKGGWVLEDTLLQEIPEDQVEDVMDKVRQNSMFEKDRLDFSKKYSKIEFAGKERTNGKTTFKLRMTTKEEQEIYFYFETEKCSLLKRKMTIEDQQGGEHELEMFGTNLKDFDGFNVFQDFERTGDGETIDKKHLSKIEFNKPFDAKLFEKPEGNFKEKK